MRTRRRATIEDLRLAIDCLPQRTRIAMLEGIAANDIIVGAYTSSDGICPMLAAHRNGGRTSLIAFAQAWDRLAFRGQRKARARRATERELLILRTHLQASLLEDEAPTGELGRARTEHEALLARRASEAEAARAAEAARVARAAQATDAARAAQATDAARAAQAADAAQVADAADRDARRARRTERRRQARPGDPHRGAELGRRGGWSWTRIVRRYDDYERLLARLDDERADAERTDTERTETPVSV